MYLNELCSRINPVVQPLPVRLDIICIGKGERALTATVAVFTSVVSAMVLEYFEIIELLRAESALELPYERRDHP